MPTPSGFPCRRPVTSFPRFVPQLERLEARALLAGTPLFATGALAGGGPHVRSFVDPTGTPGLSQFAFEPGFAGGVQVALGDVNGDGTPDLLAAAGPGGSSLVRAFDGTTGQLLHGFLAYDPRFQGGVRIAAGDVNHDGFDDIVTGAGPGGGPHVKAFSGRDGTLLASFFAYDSRFAGGVDVAAGDLDGDGFADLVTGAGPGGGPHVRAFGGRDLAPLQSFFAYDPAFRGGVHVAAGDLGSDGLADIVTGAGPGGGPHVRAFEGRTAAPLESFFAFDPAFPGGVEVAAGDADADGQPEILAAAGPGGVPVVQAFSRAGLVAATLAYDPVFQGGVSVAVNPALARAPLGANLPVLPAAAAVATASFLDPTAVVVRPERVTLGPRSYVAPFAVLDAAQGAIRIGAGSNVQDNVILTATGRGIRIGDQVILAHNATVQGEARVGSPGGRPAFVGFNAVIDGGTVEADAFLSPLTRVGPGVVIRAGTAVLPGKFIATQAEADDPGRGKVRPVTDADRAFMRGVLRVNQGLARDYTELFREEGPAAVRGISEDPGDGDSSSGHEEPQLAGVPTLDPSFRNRIIGAVQLANTREELAARMGSMDSLRADEGGPFRIGPLRQVHDRVTFHALEHTGITTRDDTAYGFHVVVHGGGDTHDAPAESTLIGENVTVGDWAVVFRSRIGAGSTIGFRALVDASTLPPGTVVRDREIIVNNQHQGFVEW